MERCLTFVKPDFFYQAGKIFDYYHGRTYELRRDAGLNEGFARTDLFLLTAEEKALRAHYAHVLKHEREEVRRVGERMIKDFAGKPIMMEIAAGRDGIIEISRQVVGPTDPKAASDDTIRGIFCKPFGYFQQDYLSRGLPVPNAIHSSGRAEEAEREIGIWTPHIPRRIEIPRI